MTGATMTDQKMAPVAKATIRCTGSLQRLLNVLVQEPFLSASRGREGVPLAAAIVEASAALSALNDALDVALRPPLVPTSAPPAPPPPPPRDPRGEG